MLKSGILPSFWGSSTYFCYMHAYDVWASPYIGSYHYVYENCIGTYYQFWQDCSEAYQSQSGKRSWRNPLSSTPLPALPAFREQRLEYLLVNLSCHKAIELVIPCVGGQNTSLKPDFLTALREPWIYLTEDSICLFKHSHSFNWWCKDTKNIPDNSIKQRLFSWNINILNRPYFLKWAQFFNRIASSFSFISVEITVSATHEFFQSGCSLVVS